MQLGLLEEQGNLFAYTDIKFEAQLNVDMMVFEYSIPPLIESPNLTIKSSEEVESDRLKEAERLKLENQLKDLFPQALEALNTFRRACRVALFMDSVRGRMLAQEIVASQRHLGVKDERSILGYILGTDAEFLFSALGDLSLTSLYGDADIQYHIQGSSGQACEGMFENGYDGLWSPKRFPDEFDDVQRLLDNGWLPLTDILLASLEFLYCDNYRMAVFNAAAALELVVVDFWERKQETLRKGSRQDLELVEKLQRQMRDSRIPTTVEKILQIALPQFVDPNLVDGGTLNRCVDAWRIRNEKAAHAAHQVREGESIKVTRDEAWNAVASVFALVNYLPALSPAQTPSHSGPPASAP